MKIVQVNATYGSGSTGKICKSISDLLTEKNIENYTLYSLGKNDETKAISFTNRNYLRVQAFKSRILGNNGFNSEKSTKKLIRELERINPNIVQIHNIHSNDVNLEILFNYLKEKEIKVFWTFHDCWAFTGYCTHFDAIGCEKWKTKCEMCPQKKETSWFFDRSDRNFEKRKILFSNMNLTIITPSQWLADIVNQSFLKNYPVKVINNGIDLKIFKPRENGFRRRYELTDKKIVLGVAFGWGEKKGLDVFCELAKRLDDTYQIVLVGTDNETDKLLPNNIISIHRTKNQKELAAIYTTADVFVNPTREENYPTVNMESLACGTPVLTFKTGGSPEIIDNTCGKFVEKNDINAMELAIVEICEKKLFSPISCVERAKEFDMNERFKEYIKLYESCFSN